MTDTDDCPRPPCADTTALKQQVSKALQAHDSLTAVRNRKGAMSAYLPEMTPADSDNAKITAASAKLNALLASLAKARQANKEQ